MFLCCLGIITNAMFLQFLHKNPNQRSIFVMMVCISNFLSSILQLVLNAIHFYNNRFSTGFLGCQIYGTNFQFFACISLIAYLCTPLDSFFIVILRRPKLSQKMQWFIAMNVLGVAFLTSWVPYWPSSHPHVLGEGKLFCFACFYCKQPLAIALALADGAASFCNPLILGSLFFWIRQRLVHSKPVAVPTSHKETEKSQVKPTHQSVQDQLQRRIAERGLVLVLVHMVTHVLTATRILYEIFTGTRITASIDIAALILQNICLSTYPVCFYLLEGSGRKWVLSVRSSISGKSTQSSTSKGILSPPQSIEVAETRPGQSIQTRPL
jgi:hypothetical protein